MCVQYVQRRKRCGYACAALAGGEQALFTPAGTAIDFNGGKSMCKRKALAGLLAAVMLLSVMPVAAAAAESSGGINTSKTASQLNAKWETEINLTVSAPADAQGKPVAVEFVMDGTESMFKTARTDGEKSILMIEKWGQEIQKALQDKNVSVGVTVFGNKAYSVQPISKLTSQSKLALDRAEVIQWLMAEENLGTNVQAGIRAGLAELNKLDATIPAENRYLVLVTDGGSFWRLDDNGNAINDTANGSHLQNTDAADRKADLKSEGSIDKLMKAAATDLNVTKEASYHTMDAAMNADAYTNFEKGVYAAAKELETIGNVKLMTVGYPYYSGDQKLMQLSDLAEGLVKKAQGKSVWFTYVAGGVESTDVESIARNIANTIGVGATYGVTVAKGSTITDQIGAGTDNLKAAYNFDLATDKDITLTINGNKFVGTKNGNTWNFGDGSRLDYTPGTGEQFVLTLGQDLQPGKTLILTYTAKLTNPSNSSGTHTVYPNVKAWLKPANSSEQIEFPRPMLSYRVGGGGGSSVLNTDDHYSYIIGYKDGYLRPYGTITRGEVATIFFRLLTDEARDKYWSQTNNYSDCNSDLWCNNAISTLSNMGIIDGYSDGTFRPYGKITRAQFAKIAVGFFETTTQEYQGYYSDISENAWFTNYVEAASRVGLIQGFADGTFRPNVNITRAQACVIVNRALDRKPATEHLLPTAKMINWPDCTPSDWYYADMQEATNSHDYRWLASGGDAKAMEKWTAKLPQRDWAAFEHAWSTAHSAPGGEVIK